MLNKEFNQVLIVEDDPATQQALHMLFKNKNIIIHEAKTGKQAYEMISAKWFDCVILDLGLPDISGKELLEKLNADKIPIPYIIIHTARDLTKTEIRELNRFSDSIVIKGVKSDERLMDEVSLFLHQIKNKHPETALSVTNNYSANPVFKGKKILLVDDDIRNIFALAQILEEKEIESNPFLVNRIMAGIEKLDQIHESSRPIPVYPNLFRTAMIGSSVAAAMFIGFLVGNIYKPVLSENKLPIEMVYLDDAALEPVDLFSYE